jgi:hypothetical protein
MRGSRWVLTLILCLAVCGLWAACGGGDDDDDDTGDDDTGDDDTGDDDTGDDDTGDDDTGDDDDVQVVDTDFGECKNTDKADDEHPEGIDLAYAEGLLTVTHVNGVFNCCVERIDVEATLEGTTLDVTETEYAPEPCNCVCPFDVATQVSGLAPGTYTVNIWSFEVLRISGEITIP